MRLLASFVVTMLVAACGLSVVGAEPPSTTDDGDASLPPTGGDGAATTGDAFADDTTTTTNNGNADGSADATLDTTPPPVCAEDLANCGGCNLVCPSGTEQCSAGKCMATLKVAVRIDGYDDLVVQGSSIRWHHLTWDVPKATTLNGVVWTPTYPPKPAGCGYCGDPGQPAPQCFCDSTNAGVLAPSLAAHDSQSGAVKAMTGRGNVTIAQQPSTANGYTLIVHFNDPMPGSDDFTASIVYETR